MIGDTWYPIASMRILKYFLIYSANLKARVHQLDFIGAFRQSNVKHRVFLKLYSRYGEYFPYYANYFEISLRLKKSMYLMTNYGNLFADELTNWLIYESDFKHFKCQMYVY